MRKITMLALMGALLGLVQGQGIELPPIFEGNPEEPVGQPKANSQLKEVKIGEKYPVHMLPADFAKGQWAFFRLHDALIDFEEDKLKGADLTFELIENNEFVHFQDPNIYIMLVSIKVTKQGDIEPTLDKHDIKCDFYGVDLCIVNEAEYLSAKDQTITVGKTFQLVSGIFCREECDFFLDVGFATEQWLEDGKEIEQYFYPNQERIYKFAVPDDETIQAIEFRTNAVDHFDKYLVLVAKGDDEPSTNKGKFFRAAWQNGYVGKIERSSATWCLGCNMTLLVASEDVNGKIRISASTSKTDKVLTDGVPIFDMVLSGEATCYTFDLKKKEEDLRINLQPFSGDPDIYVHAGEKPVYLQQFTWNSKDRYESEELVISYKERKAMMGALADNTTDFHICIFGMQIGSYKLTVYNSLHAIYLTPGISESAYLDTNETTNFYFRDPRMFYEDFQVKFTLHVMAGKARLRSKLCPVSDKNDTEKAILKGCVMTDEEMFAVDPEEKMSYGIGTEEEAPDSSICKVKHHERSEDGEEILTRKKMPPCVYVVGLAGLAPFKTHYSVLVEVTMNYTLHKELVEGKPLRDITKAHNEKYYHFRVLDPRVKNVVVQATTIHGDPELFVSRKHEKPGPAAFERRGVASGIFPEIATFMHTINGETLDGDYYVMVGSNDESTYQLVYYTEIEQGNQTSAVQLSKGQQQKGVMTSFSDALLYQFTLPGKYEDEVLVRLHPINGHFLLKVAAAEGDKLIGESSDFVVFQHASTPEPTVYYAFVVPDPDYFREEDPAGIPLSFTVGFYDSQSLMPLASGVPLNGKVRAGESVFYIYSAGAESARKQTIDLTLTAISGNPDIYVSTNGKLASEHNYVAKNEEKSLGTTSLTVEVEKGQDIIVQILGASLQFGDEVMAEFSLVAQPRDGFNPIQLFSGITQFGKVAAGSANHYFFQTGSNQDQFVMLAPVAGNPDLYLQVVTGEHTNKSEWVKIEPTKPKTYDASSKDHFGNDIIYLTQEGEVLKKCGSACILHMVVFAQGEENASYSLTVSRGLTDLPDNQQVFSMIPVKGGYSYFRYHKPCGEICDMEIVVQSTSVHLLDVIVRKGLDQLPEFDDQRIKADEDEEKELHPGDGGRRLDFWDLFKKKEDKKKPKDNDVIFSKQGVGVVQLVVAHNDERYGKEDSEGDYVIGVYSYANQTFSIVARSVRKDQLPQTPEGSPQGEDLPLTKLFQGNSHDYYLYGFNEALFYFENHVNATLKFQVETNILQSLTTCVAPMLKTTPNELAKLWAGRDPAESFEFGEEWICTDSQNQYSRSSVTLDPQTLSRFCVHCFYAVKVLEPRAAAQQKTRFKYAIYQSDTHGGFTSQLASGTPTRLALSENEVAVYKIPISQTHEKSAQLSLRLISGTDFEIEFYGDVGDQTVVFEPYYQQWGPNFLFTVYRNSTENIETLYMKVEARQELEASLVLRTESEMFSYLEVIMESQPVKVSSDREAQYFLYLPPSDRFYLSINYWVELDSSDPVGNHAAPGQTFDPSDLPDIIRVYFKSISPAEASNLFRDNSSLEEAIVEYDTFYKFTEAQNFFMNEFQLKGESELLLIKVTGHPKGQSFLELSGSQISALQIGKPLHGAVRSEQRQYKVYQLIYDRDSLYAPDLSIEVQACKGSVEFYVSEDFATLWDRKNSHLSNAKSQSMHGNMVYRVQNLKEKEQIYIGVQSFNRFIMDMVGLKQSDFQIVARLVDTDQFEGQEYEFEDHVDVLLGQQYYENLRKNGLEKNKLDHEVIVGSDSLHVQWQEVRDFSSGEPKVMKNVIYQVFASEFESELTSHCAVTARKKIPLLKVKGTNHADLNRDSLPESARYLNVFAVVSEEQKNPPLDVTVRSSIVEVNQVIQPPTFREIYLAYEPTLIPLVPEPTFFQEYGRVIAVCLGLLLAAMGCLLWWFRQRNVGLKKKLDFVVQTNELVGGTELSDLSGRAHE